MMSNYPTPSAKFKAAGLWKKVSTRGNEYFVGRLGGVRIVILENHARAGENEATHILYFADGETPRPETRDQALARAPARAPPHRRPSYPAPRRSSPGDAHALPDPVDDLWQQSR
jgi:hypothetical protein